MLFRSRFHAVGFQVVEYVGYFGHSGSATTGVGYYDRWPLLSRMHVAFCRGLTRVPAPWLTTLAMVRLQRPIDAPGQDRFNSGR